MRTLLKVKPEMNGTLKKQSQNRVSAASRRLAVVILLGILSIGGMAFTESDTTKNTGDTGINNTKMILKDSCCSVTYVQANQNIMIVNTSYFTGKITINNMDLKSWANSMMAYSFQKLNLRSVESADKRMDVSFTAEEIRNRRLAVAFSKEISEEASATDEILADNFMKNVAAPIFTKEILEEAFTADVVLDKIINNEVEEKAKIAAFKSGLLSELNNSDLTMDQMVASTQMTNITPAAAANADRLLDEQLNNKMFRQLKPSVANEADLKMDLLLENK